MATLRKKPADSSLDLAQAAKMQEMILPRKGTLDNIEQRLGIKVFSYCEPCEITGGDFWGVEQICNDYIAFYIVDCSGHGFSAALNTFRLHALIEDIEDIYLKLMPTNFMALLNQKMCNLLPPGQFATMFYGVVNTKNHDMVYATASATRPIMITRGGKIKTLEGTGFPLGANKDADFASQRVKFNKGDRLFLYSDALTEVFNAKGKMFGEERLLKLFDKYSKLECSNLIDRVINKQKTFRHGPLQDDLTVNVYHRL